MSISPSVLENVRERAAYSCEYCEISETDNGGELTIDHFRPLSKGGDDDEKNLVYCCFRCNSYKGDYWNEEIPLWNPRTDKRDDYFWLSDNGKLFPLNETAEFTFKLLRLNRQPLVTKRQNDLQQIEERQTLEQSQKAVESLIRLSRQQSDLLKQQQTLLKEQRRLIEFFSR